MYRRRNLPEPDSRSTGHTVVTCAPSWEELPEWPFAAFPLALKEGTGALPLLSLLRTICLGKETIKGKLGGGKCACTSLTSGKSWTLIDNPIFCSCDQFLRHFFRQKSNTRITTTQSINTVYSGSPNHHEKLTDAISSR